MSETIRVIKPYEGADGRDWGREAGYQIVTSEQTITLSIEDMSCCCERWGYFLTEDDVDKFIGARLQGVAITDTNRSTRKFVTGWDVSDGPNVDHLDEGDVMFVDIETDRGILQFVAYNSHNGYYGHEARVSSKQLTATKCL